MAGEKDIGFARSVQRANPRSFFIPLTIPYPASRSPPLHCVTKSLRHLDRKAAASGERLRRFTSNFGIAATRR